MSMVHSFRMVGAVALGLVCSTVLAKVEPNKPKVEDAQPAQAQQGEVVASGEATIVVTGQAMAVPAGGIPGGGVQLNMDANGGKEVQVEQYGKKIKITDDSQKGIKIERITHKGGTDVTEKFEAKDAKELQKKFPEGFKLYNEYLGNIGQAGGPPVAMGVLQLQAVPGQGPMPLPPGAFPMPQAGGIQLGAAQGQIQVIQAATVAGPMELDGVNAMMQGLSEGLKMFGKADKAKEAAQPAKDAAKKQIGELKKQLSDLEKQLDAK